MRKNQRVTIGSQVVVKFKDGSQETFCIVYSQKSDPSKGKISNESPLGQAILGQETNGKIYYATPLGQKISC
ncbi:MAG: GreA/GreB family elongation factor, partial [Candidatus Bathyarchaeia archaeon]